MPSSWSAYRIGRQGGHCWLSSLLQNLQEFVGSRVKLFSVAYKAHHSLAPINLLRVFSGHPANHKSLCPRIREDTRPVCFMGKEGFSQQTSISLISQNFITWPPHSCEEGKESEHSCLSIWGAGGRGDWFQDPCGFQNPWMLKSLI